MTMGGMDQGWIAIESILSLIFILRIYLLDSLISIYNQIAKLFFDAK